MSPQTDIRRMCIFRKENRHLTRLDCNECCGCVSEKNYIAVGIIWPAGKLQISERTPPHLFGAFKRQLDVYILSMSLKLNFLSR